jgi:squalene-hopene cyclase-like protein
MSPASDLPSGDPGVSPPAASVAGAARDLLDGLAGRPWGQVSVSVYETARLVCLAPWLDGHTERIRFLQQRQRTDGAWGGPGGYGLVPTLSATDACLTALRRDAPTLHQDKVRDVVRCANGALAALAQWARTPPRGPLPDTPAIEVIVPALVAAVNAHLDQLRRRPVPGLDRWVGMQPLPCPAGLDSQPVRRLRTLLRQGGAVPAKVLHSLEVAAPLSRHTPPACAHPMGTVGASPAATAAWLSAQPPSRRDPVAVRYLQAVAAGPHAAVPSVTPITIFERAWVLSWLADVAVTVPAQLLASLAGSIGASGTPGGAGLPPDADTTSVALLTLDRHGWRSELDCLLEYETDTHFRTWPDERTASVSTNAHVLDAIGYRLSRRPDQTRYYPARDKLIRWLCQCQASDGSWTDKWHASPLYPTVCCVQALCRVNDARAARAVRRAAGWVLDTQRPDGSWGRWGATREESAYALHILICAGARGRVPALVHDRVIAAVTRGRAYLLSLGLGLGIGRSLGGEVRDSAAAGVQRPEDPPLWHDKDLYRPEAVVNACVLAALYASDPLGSPPS